MAESTTNGNATILHRVVSCHSSPLSLAFVLPVGVSMEIGGGDRYSYGGATVRAGRDPFAKGVSQFSKREVSSESSSRSNRETTNFDLRGEEETSGLSLVGFPRRRPATRSFGDRVDLGLGDSGTRGGFARYRQPFRTRFSDSTSSHDDRETVPAYCRIPADQTMATPSKNEDERLTNLNGGFYREDHSNKKNQHGIDGVEHLSRDPVQFFRRLDELRYWTSRSCEVAKPTEKTPVTGRPFGSRRSGEATEKTRKKMSNFSSPLCDDRGYEELYRPQPPGKSLYPVKPRNGEYLHNEFAVDSLISYCHDEFNHHSSCYCTNCLRKHKTLPERPIPRSINNHSQGTSYPAQKHGFHPAGSQKLGTQEHDERVAGDAILEVKDRRPCQAFSGGAPFFICSSCFELLRLPQITLLTSKKLCKLRCGLCSEVLSIELIGNRLVTSARSSSISTSKANSSCHVQDNQPQSILYISTNSDASSPKAYGGSAKIYSQQAIINSPFAPSHELVERQNMLNLSAVERVEGISGFASI